MSVQVQRIAAIQMTSGTDVGDNLAQAALSLKKAAAEGAMIALLPENFALLESGDQRSAGQAEAEGKGRILNFLKQQAKEHRLWIIGGTLPWARRPDGVFLNERVRASCFVLDDNGTERARYDKIHLFDADVADAQGVYRESVKVEPGNQPVVVNTPLGKIGLSICYDLRFPELYRRLGEMGADIIVVPSAFTYRTGRAHWEVLLRARAIENQCYMVAANQCGQHSENRRTWGHSMVVDPWGVVLEEASEDQPEVIVSAVELQRLQDIRSAMPQFQHRRVGL